MLPFVLTVPSSGRTAVLVEVPHAGLAIPDVVRDELAIGLPEIVRDADLYVDKLYEASPEVGAALLVASPSRYVVDLNRSPDDVDAETVTDHPMPRANQPRGVVWRATTEGRPALRRPLRYTELQYRLSSFHTPYHGALERTLGEIRDRFGFAVLLAAHSMPSVGRSSHTDSGARRADVVPGTRGRTTASSSLIDLVDGHFRGAGLSVRHDDPYRGGFTTAHYGRPARAVHAIQVELNRALYMNEETSEPKTPEFDALAAVVTDLVAKLGAWRPD
jgi:N-formylglutamate deformylase